ncbi:MAG: AraC family transcriptional regulator ligand-binding domain-containing protein [Bacteroidota bacterium]
MDLNLLENRITEAEYQKVVKDLVDQTHDYYLGLHLGCFLNIKAMGLIFTISKSATSIEQAVLFLQDFLSHTFPIIEVRSKTVGDISSLELDCLLHDESVKRHVLDATLCILYRELHLMTGRPSAINIGFPYPELKEYRRAIGSHVRNSTRHNLSFQKKILNEQLNQKNLNAISELLPAFLHMLETAKGNRDLKSRVKKMILTMCAPELPDLENVAAQFNAGSRSFQRALTGEGTSFRRITEDIKRDLSRYFRRGSALKTQDIAYLLGYSDASAYLHAERRWNKK